MKLYNKKTMKITAYIIIGLMWITLPAQNADKAEALLQEVSSKIKTYKNISIDFKYALNNQSENISQETRGSVVLEGDKYVLNILGATRIFDGKTLYTISPDDEEVTISSNNTEDEDTITPNKMLSFYTDGYSYAMDIVQNISGRKIQYVKLSPIDSNSDINYILLGIDANTKHIYNLIEIGKNGTRTTLTVNSLKTNEALSKNLFSFDKEKYKGFFINKID
jgi:outer membrane lipoprotein-sorting protein